MKSVGNVWQDWAPMKTSYDESGYQLFRGAWPREDIGALGDMAYDLLTPYRGKILRQNGKLEFNEFLPDRKSVV